MSPTAVFLDRDGVINDLIWNPQTDSYESPHFVDDFKLIERVTDAVSILSDCGFKLFIVSNQPSFAKGKTTLEQLAAIHKRMLKEFERFDFSFTQCYYSYCHPDSKVPGYGPPCNGRKPDPSFLFDAQMGHSLDLKNSWMIGDQDTDIICGKKAKCRTISILNPHSAEKRGKVKADLQCKNLYEAATLIKRILSAPDVRGSELD